MKKNIQLTTKGYQELKKELEDLLKTKRPKLVDRLSNARSQGDLSENSDYQNAKEELEFLDGKIEELQDVIKNAKVVEEFKGGRGINIGSKVTVSVNGVQNTFEIVGEWEANLASKKISCISPLGEALIGKNVGDKFEIEAPVGKMRYEIIAIE